MLNADEITAGRGGEVSVEGGAHGGNKGRRDRGVQRKGQFAIFEKTCGGEVLAADDERGVVGEQDFFAVIVFWCCSALDLGPLTALSRSNAAALVLRPGHVPRSTRAWLGLCCGSPPRFATERSPPW